LTFKRLLFNFVVLTNTMGMSHFKVLMVWWHRFTVWWKRNHL